MLVDKCSADSHVMKIKSVSRNKFCVLLKLKKV